MLTGFEPQIIYQESKDFLKGDGVCVHKDCYTYIKLYGYEKKPLLLLMFVRDNYFFPNLVDNIVHGVSFFIRRSSSSSYSITL